METNFNKTDSKKTNIILIGMPGSGKSTIGRLLSEKLELARVDGDSIIENAEGRTLQEIIDTEGKDYFLSLEGKILAELQLENHIISPGGSVCYYPEAMKHLSEIGHIVYLDVEFPEIQRRVNNLDSRGIVFKPGQSFEDLYAERTPLYDKYAEIRVNSTSLSPEETVTAIIDRLNNLK